MKVKKDLISIIVPYFKKKNYLEKTLDSISLQTYKNIELLIIFDDHDKSELDYVKQLLKSYKKLKSKLIVNHKNLGVGISRNRGVKFAKGKFLAFCDADDIWKKNKLQLQLDFMKKNKLQISHTGYDVINDKSKIIGSFIPKDNLTFKDLIKSCDIGLSTVIVSKNLFKKFYFSKLKTKEDYLLWLKIIKKLKAIYGINIKLSSWRKTNNSLSSSTIQKFLDAFCLYNYYLKYNFFLSLFYVLRLTFYAIRKNFLIYF